MLRFRRRLLVSLLVLAPVAAVLAKSLDSHERDTARPRTQAEPCDAWVDGTKYPFLVPTHLAWGELWARADRARVNGGDRQRLLNELQVRDATIGQILLISSSRQSQPLAQATLAGPQALEAQRAISARDLLLREIQEDERPRLSDWVREAARKPYRLGVQGKIVRLDDGRSVCEVAINGNLHPYLIPEYETWAFYFRSMADVASLNRTAPGEYPASLIRALQRDHLPIPEAEVVRLLNLAVDITARLDAPQLEGPNVDHVARAEESARVVLMVRQKLMLSLDPGSWEAVLNDTARIRRGTIYRYPGF